MAHYTKHILLAITLCSAVAGFSQNIRIKTDGSPAPRFPATLALPLEQRQQTLKTVEAVLSDYAQKAPLLDKVKKQVTSETVGAFTALFNPNAFLVKDYEENIQSELISIREYTSGVYNRMGREGVQVKVGNATLQEIIDDPAGYWVVVVKVEKLLYNYVTAKNEVKVNAGGRFLEQEFRFDVPKNDLSRGRIAKISRVCKGRECEVAGQYARYIGPAVGVHKPFISPSYNGFWESAPNAGEFEVSGGIGFSGGFEFLTNRLSAKTSPDKNLFVGLGLRFSYNQFTGELSDHDIVPFQAEATNNTGSQGYTRIPTDISAKEKLSVGTIEVPLGVGIRFKESQKSDFILNVRVIPAFIALKGSGSLEGKGTYDASIPEAEWRILETKAANPDLFAEDSGYGPFEPGLGVDLVGKPSPTLKGLALAAQLSPTMFFHLSDDNPNWSLMLGLDLTYHLGSFFEYSETNDYLFKFREDANYNSLTEHYLKGMSNFSAGLRVGLLHHLKTKP